MPPETKTSGHRCGSRTFLFAAYFLATLNVAVPLSDPDDNDVNNSL